MIRRFSNPTILQNATKIISRAELYDSNDDGDAHTIDYEPRLKRLRELVEDSLGDLTPRAVVESHRKKRRKVEASSEGDVNELICTFRSCYILCR